MVTEGSKVPMIPLWAEVTPLLLEMLVDGVKIDIVF